MTEAELIKLIKRTVRLELAQITLGSVVDTDDSSTMSAQRFATDSQLDDLRMIRPYGFASRPPEDTATVIVPINGDPSHLIAVGDYDENRPDVDSGEAALYSSNGQTIWTADTDVFIGDYLSETGEFLTIRRAAFHNDGSYELGFESTVSSNADGEVFIGSPSASNPLVLGDILQTFCDQIITILTTALTAVQTGPIAITTTPGNPAPTSPVVIAALTTAVSNLATLKATYVTNPASNFISMTNFTERGA